MLPNYQARSPFVLKHTTSSRGVEWEQGVGASDPSDFNNPLPSESEMTEASGTGSGTGDMSQLLMAMLQQQNQQREEDNRRMRELEAERLRYMKEAEENRLRTEEKRNADVLELERQRMEVDRARIEADKARREEEKTKREEEMSERFRAEGLKERLRGIGSYKEGEDLAAYLGQIEFALKDSKVDKKEWCVKLLPRLTPKLAESVRPRMEAGASYDEIRGSLMGMVGATVAVYGHQLFAVNTESLRKLNSSQVIDHLTKIVQGLFQDVNTKDDAVYVMVKALLREHLPQNGRVFLESSTNNTMEELRNVLDAWMSTRAVGDMTRVPGSSSSSKVV